MAALRRELLVASLLLGIAGLPLYSCDQNVSTYDSNWQFTQATWYGNPQGDGSDGGACGYTALSSTPYGSVIAAGSAPIFQNGQGCGSCYQIRCTHSICKLAATTVVITDFCPGGQFCDEYQVGFDLSGATVSNLAVWGQEDALRNIGVLDVLYRRVPCWYPGQNVAFTVDAGSTAYWLSLIVRYEGGPGDLQAVEIQQAGSSQWQPLQHNWGANWMLLTYGSAINAPLSVRLTTILREQVLVAYDVIPSYWAAGATYSSEVQFTY